MTQTERLAGAFSAVLRRWFGPDELAEVVARNRAETNPYICHSHDFCDANMAMVEAFTAVLGREPSIKDQADNDLWLAAWDMAQTNEFKETP